MVDIIIINGPSCAGKSTISKKICKLSGDKFVHLQIDATGEFYNSIFYKGFKFAENDLGTENNDWNKNRFARRKVIAGILLSTAKELLSKKFKVVVDTALDGPDAKELAQLYLKYLADYETKFIGIYCPLEERLKRLRTRPDIGPRTEKFVRSQTEEFDVFEANKHSYDIWFDSSKLDSALIAKDILKFIGF